MRSAPESGPELQLFRVWRRSSNSLWTKNLRGAGGGQGDGTLTPLRIVQSAQTVGEAVAERFHDKCSTGGAALMAPRRRRRGTLGEHLGRFSSGFGSPRLLDGAGADARIVGCTALDELRRPAPPIAMHGVGFAQGVTWGLYGKAKRRSPRSGGSGDASAG